MLNCIRMIMLCHCPNHNMHLIKIVVLLITLLVLQLPVTVTPIAVISTPAAKAPSQVSPVPVMRGMSVLALCVQVSLRGSKRQHIGQMSQKINTEKGTKCFTFYDMNGHE